MYEYFGKGNRYIYFSEPSGHYHKLIQHTDSHIMYISEEVDKKFIVISIFNKAINRVEKIISNVELELNTEIQPNMDTYFLKQDILSSSD